MTKSDINEVKLGGAKRKNGHKANCTCHICENMKKKAQRGGYEEEVEKEEEIDYSTYSEKEIMDEIDSALDSGDYSRVEMLSKYLKNESLNIVLRELKLIKESVNLHTK